MQEKEVSSERSGEMRETESSKEEEAGWVARVNDSLFLKMVTLMRLHN